MLGPPQLYSMHRVFIVVRWDRAVVGRDLAARPLGPPTQVNVSPRGSALLVNGRSSKSKSSQRALFSRSTQLSAGKVVYRNGRSIDSHRRREARFLSRRPTFAPAGFDSRARKRPNATNHRSLFFLRGTTPVRIPGRLTSVTYNGNLCLMTQLVRAEIIGDAAASRVNFRSAANDNGGTRQSRVPRDRRFGSQKAPGLG